MKRTSKKPRDVKNLAWAQEAAALGCPYLTITKDKTLFLTHTGKARDVRSAPDGLRFIIGATVSMWLNIKRNEGPATLVACKSIQEWNSLIAIEELAIEAACFAQNKQPKIKRGTK